MTLPGSPRDVVITGLGPITAVGIGVEGFWDGLRRRESPVARVDRFDTSAFRSRVAAQVPDFDPTGYLDPTEARRLDRFGQFILASSQLALDDAGLDPEAVDPERGAIQMGSALGGVARAEAQVPIFGERGLRGVDPRLALQVYVGAASCQAAIRTGFTGPNATNGMSCASGAMAVGEAWRLIRSGEADVALAGGGEAPLAPLTFGAFALIRAMSSRNDDPARACRPFDAGRDGFVMGEGACTVVLESAEHAEARGARVYARLTGYGTSNDAYHMTAPRPDGTSAGRAMLQAMRTAGLAAEDVDLVNAHGSSTPLNDSTESRVIRSVLADRADDVPVCATKPYHGHALGASGAIEVAVSALAIQRGWVPPVLNLEEPGEDCDLSYVRGQGAGLSPRNVLSNSFGFGGINVCLAVSAPRSA
jgi:3-oxoacyl-[acyl-carrier-protein] synthase II